MTLAGNPRFRKNHPAQCTAVTAKLYVRCCSPSGGKVKMSTYGCNAGKTFAQAEAICAAKKLRSCTQAEITAGKTSGTGCGYDNKRVWTSTGSGSGGLVERPIDNDTASPTRAPKRTTTPTEVPSTLTPSTTDEPSAAPTTTPTEPPTEASTVPSCQDNNPSGLRGRSGPMTCAQLKPYCSSHPTLVVPRCPKTCTGCAPTKAPTKPPPPLPVKPGTAGPMCNDKKKFVGTCGNCVSSVQCKQGFCCPFMKKCVPSSRHGCGGGATGFGSCRPTCHSALNCPGCTNKKYPNQWVNCDKGDASGV